MKEIIDILTVFFNIFRNDILEYYQKSYSYLKDLIAYKKVNLDKKIETENDKQIKKSVEKMLKAIKTGLNTIGLPIDILNESQNKFMEALSKGEYLFTDYNSYFEIYSKNYLNNLLFGILIDYLLDLEVKKLENVNLFDLLPPYFISRLNEFKRSHFSNPEIIEMFKRQNYEAFINFTDLSVIKPKKILEADILTQLREAKEVSIESLKTPKKELIKPPIGIIEEDLEEKIYQIESSKPSTPQIVHEFDIILNTGTFLDHFGFFTPIHPEIINKFKIDKLSLINSTVVNRDYFDLESLFYYVSILKMLNLELPFTNDEIVGILKNFINRWVFCSSKDNLPDSINNFYGLAIFSELGLLNTPDVIDLQEIENFIIADLEKFIPEKLELNLHSLLCLKLITKSQKHLSKRFLNLDSIVDFNLLEMENLAPTFDIYNHLASLKLLGQEVKINNLQTPYIDKIKKLISSNGSIDDLITKSARALLIFDLLNLKEQESDLCSNLLNYIINKTSFFSMENLDINFNWRSDILGFKIELEILYWALLASSQFPPITY